MSVMLTRKRAEERFASMEAGIEYDLYLNLEKGKDFNGFGRYTFTLKNTDNVFLNYSGKNVEKVWVNKKEMSEEQIKENWKNGDLNLPATNLTVGKNCVEVQFVNAYNTDGNGLHSTTKPDGKQYIYSQSEPFHTNRVYPVFDQPDLKGKMTFHFLSPADWRIVANTDFTLNQTLTDLDLNRENQTCFEKRVLELLKDDFKGEKQYYSFKQTKILSTYLFAFVGGPYETLPYDNSDGETFPMNIYCTSSDLKYAKEQQQHIFYYCKRGIEYYTKFFQTPNPFDKYDIVFCPEYTVGAMEYPGVITFTDRLLFKQKCTKIQVSIFGHVMTHELAHMWFGNLVTMKWWNDLWLNESFADFVCFLCQNTIDKDMPFGTVDAWTEMFKRKGWGYREDQLDTTHPIACEVVNTSVAESIFDGITYSKGASVVKQLFFLIGEEKFSDNLKNYFSKYGWGNATLKNFLDEISNTEGGDKHKAYDLNNFNASWIETAGLNQIEASWDPSVQGKQTITFKQSPASPEHPTLRFHKLNFAALDENCNIVHTQEFILEDKEETTVEFENKNYKAIIPNYGDWGYIKIILDQNSLKFLEQNLSKIKCNLTLLLTVRSLYDMVSDARYRGTEFIDTLINTGFLRSLINNLQILKGTNDFLSGAISLCPKTFRKEYNEKIFNECVYMLSKATDEDVISILKGTMISNAKSLDAIEVLKNVFDETHPTLKLNLALEENWKVIYKMNCSSRYSSKQKQIYIDYMLSEDKTDIGKKWLLAINALTDDDSELEKLWENYTNKEKRTMSYKDMEYSLIGFTSEYRNTYNRHQFRKRFFEILPAFFKGESKQFGSVFFGCGFRGWENTQYLIDNLVKVVDQIDESNLFFKIRVNKTISSLKQFQKCCKLYE